MLLGPHAAGSAGTGEGAHATPPQVGAPLCRADVPGARARAPGAVLRKLRRLSSGPPAPAAVQPGAPGGSGPLRRRTARLRGSDGRHARADEPRRSPDV